MGLVELHRVGSDPEFSFAVPDQAGNVHLLSADVLVGGDRDLRLKSFIGTDGHPSTAELRPAPCNNVYWHLLKIADGLNEVDRSMQYYSVKRDHPIVAVSQPSLGKGPSGQLETMGGHIWISMWFNSKISANAIHDGGYIWNGDSHDSYPSRQGRENGKRLTPKQYQDYMDLATSGQELSMDLCWRKLHYLLHPLEMMLFGKVRGDRQPGGSGVKDPYIRLPDHATSDDLACYREGKAYIRFEYRFPSTWLQHPTLAFVYLGLAKLAILNWDLLPGLSDLQKENLLVHTVAGHSVNLWRDILKRRVAYLMDQKEVRSTRDLRGLFDALEELYKVTLTFPALINFEAWASLRAPGR